MPTPTPEQHADLIELELHRPYHFEQDTDPGAVGAGLYWLNTTAAPYPVYRRNATNTAWGLVGSVNGTPSAHATTHQHGGGDEVGSSLPSANAIVKATAGGKIYIDWLPIVTVQYGGTGLNSLATYAVVCGGTTTTGTVQQVSGLGTAGQVLTSAGPGALPVWAAAAAAATVTVADAGGDTTCWVMLATSQTGSLTPATDSGLTYNASTNALTATTFIGALTGNASTVTTNANLTGPVTSVGNATTIAAGVVTEAMQVLADNTTQDVSITKHGYAPKAPNDATKFLNGAGAYSTPPGTGSTSPLTTLGDLWGFSTVDDRKPVGVDGEILTADSSDPLGVSWQPAETGVWRYYTPGTYSLFLLAGDYEVFVIGGGGAGGRGWSNGGGGGGGGGRAGSRLYTLGADTTMLIAVGAGGDDLVPNDGMPSFVVSSGAYSPTYIGTTDCSANPDYPAATAGDYYVVSVAGKIGGASGTVVAKGDIFLATADNAGGDEATVGSSWAHQDDLPFWAGGGWNGEWGSSIADTPAAGGDAGAAGGTDADAGYTNDGSVGEPNSGTAHVDGGDGGKAGDDPNVGGGGTGGTYPAGTGFIGQRGGVGDGSGGSGATYVSSQPGRAGMVWIRWLQSSVTGNAGTVTVVDAASDTTCWPLLARSQTGNQAPTTDAGLTYNATTNALSTTTFIGALTGNASGSSGSCTGNAATVTTNANLTGPITSSGNATAIASQTGTGTKFVVDTSPTLVTPTLGIASATSVNKVTITAPATSATLTIDDGFTLHATGNVTALSGTNTGDQTSVSGNAGTVTVADAGGDTTTWVLLGTSQTGSLAPATDSGITYNATSNALTLGGGLTLGGVVTFGASVANVGKIINLFESGTTVMGLGMDNATASMRSYLAGASDQFFSWGSISTGDGTTYTELMRLTQTGKLSVGSVAFGSTSYLTITATDNSALYSVLQQHGTGLVSLYMTRDGGTSSIWQWYLPSGSTDLRVNDGNGDIVIVQNAGFQVRRGGATVGTYFVGVGGTIATDATSTGNTAATLTTLYSETVRANTLNANGERYRARFRITFAANANADKQVDVVWGATTIFTLGSLAHNAKTGILEVDVGRTGSSSQRGTVKLEVSGSAAIIQPVDSSESMTADKTLAIKGSGTGASDVVEDDAATGWNPAGPGA